MAETPNFYADLVDAVVSDAQTLGLFDRVQGLEPKNAPGNGVTAAAWLRTVAPARGASGLAATTTLIVMTVRIYTSAIQEPADAIDPNLYRALSGLMAAYSGDFQLDGLIRNVDLLGAYGPGLSASTGYLSIDSKMFRIADITLPLVVNDVYDQAP